MRSLFARCHIRMLALWVVLLLSGTEVEAEMQANKINKKTRFEFLFLFYLLRPHFSCVLVDFTCSSALSPGGGLSCDYIWWKNKYLWLMLLKGYCHLLRQPSTVTKLQFTGFSLIQLNLYTEGVGLERFPSYLFMTIQVLRHLAVCLWQLWFGRHTLLTIQFLLCQKQRKYGGRGKTKNQ